LINRAQFRDDFVAAIRGAIPTAQIALQGKLAFRAFDSNGMNLQRNLENARKIFTGTPEPKTNSQPGRLPGPLTVLPVERRALPRHAPIMNSETSSTPFDTVVIGGGSAGYAAARVSAAGGLKTAVIEGGQEVGGLCILRGCMPTKALLYAAEVLHLARRGRTWGLDITVAGFDFAKVMERKNAMIQDFGEFRRGQLADGRFTLIRASAAFLDPYTLQLDNGQTVTGRHFVIATGSVVAPPPWPSLAETGYWTSDDVLRASSPPKSLIVLGGGAVALEIAQFLARFDTQVTIIQRSPRVLRDFDNDLSTELERSLVAEGIRIFTGTQVDTVLQTNAGKEVVFRHQGVETSGVAEQILHALGRVPATAGLCLDNAGVELDHGRVATDASMRTTAPHIYAAGDCAGPHEIVHIAVQQGEIAGHNIVNPERPRQIDYRLLMEVVFTDPQVAVVGLTERLARERGIPHVAASYPFNDHGKSLIMEAKAGFVKLLANPETGEIIGGAILGPGGGDLIHEIVAAMAGRLTVHQFANMPHYHPTLAEIWSYPAEELAEKIPPGAG
jgi:pyruvate/2-oxoglutarate dehydrogenase complex dihydrolipoamide dehydrogenase (E3) component